MTAGDGLNGNWAQIWLSATGAWHLRCLDCGWMTAGKGMPDPRTINPHIRKHHCPKEST